MTLVIILALILWAFAALQVTPVQNESDKQSVERSSKGFGMLGIVIVLIIVYITSQG